MKILKLLLIGAIGLSLFACDKDDDDNNSSTNRKQQITVALTLEETNDLKFLREEEKLAHDVYTYASQLYTPMIFQNIANSEQKHTDAVRDLLIKYNINDPAENLAIGQFSDSIFIELYATLTKMVDSSENHAFYVGATIEDLDIYDISELIKNTTKADILNLYDNLMCGSRNHMRNYVSNLNGNYAPKYITQSDYNSIISSSNEKCGN